MMHFSDMVEFSSNIINIGSSGKHTFKFTDYTVKQNLLVLANMLYCSCTLELQQFTDYFKLLHFKR